MKRSKKDLLKSLNFTTESLMFNGTDTIVIKEKSNDFKDKERIKAYKDLDYCNGNYTNDYDTIEYIIDNFKKESRDYKNKVIKGEIKKIIVVMSDGQSSDQDLLQENIEKLRNLGILVYGIGITNSGRNIVESYKGENKELGFGQVCEESSDLAKTLKDLLKGHLDNI